LEALERTERERETEIPSLQEKFQPKKKAKRNGNLAPNLDNKKEKKLQTVVGQRNTSFTPQIPERASEEEKSIHRSSRSHSINFDFPVG